MSDRNEHVETLHHIRWLMQQSSRFISLSGLSGVAAGLWALVGAYFAHRLIDYYYKGYNNNGYSGSAFQQLEWKLLLLAAGVLGAALISAFFFTWRKATEDKQPIWNRAARTLTLNMMIPLVTGGLVLLALLQQDQWRFIAPLSLIFYGLALVNASKYTLNDIRYLGISEIILGLLNMQFIGYGLHFWALGFGVLHIIYGFAMWWKNERTGAKIEVKE